MSFSCATFCVRQVLAKALGTTASEVAIDDVVFSSTTASDIDTEDAASTFFGDDEGSASEAAVSTATAVLL